MAIQEITSVLVFHKTEPAAGSSVAASFPKASDIFDDLKTARGQGVAQSYINRAERDDSPITFPRLGITLGYANASAIKALRKHPGVSHVTPAPSMSGVRPVRIAQATLTRNVTWGLETLGVERLWKQGLTGQGVLVGHLDTGVDASHPALKGRVADFAEWDFLGGKVAKSKPHDSATHGTHTAATICGVAVQGRSVGVAPDAQICSGMVIEGGKVIARVLGGLDWLIGLNVRVISMSLGFPDYEPAFTRVVDILVSRNIVPVFAIGNEGANTSRSPGNYPDSIAIGAIGKDGLTPSFSGSEHFNRKDDPDKPDCVAPGVAVISAKPGGGWQEMDGTSMATPHVAGVVALLLQAKPGASASEIRKALLDSSKPIDGEPPLRYGHGVVQPVEALKLLTGVSAGSATKKRRAVKLKRGHKK
jgi:subtilisin